METGADGGTMVMAERLAKLPGVAEAASRPPPDALVRVRGGSPPTSWISWTRDRQHRRPVDPGRAGR